MNISELILNKNQILPFILTVIITVSLHKYLDKQYNGVSIDLGVLLCIIYLLFIIVYRIINTNTNFSKPLVNYIIQKKNFREEPYQINYVNPFVTNLDNVNFNMKRSTNKKYVKRKLNELLIRKYVQFENVLSFNPDPWKIIELTENGTTAPNTKYKELSRFISGQQFIRDNKYCRNYLPTSTVGAGEYAKNYKQFLVLYRKEILKFKNKKYFIFEKKNKPHSKYYLYECISQIIFHDGVPGSEVADTIIDTRDLYYDRQYIIFTDFPTPTDKTGTAAFAPPSSSSARTGTPNLEANQWPHNAIIMDNEWVYQAEGTTITAEIAELQKWTRRGYASKITVSQLSPKQKMEKLRDFPSKYYWQNDTQIREVYVIDIYFIYNDMEVLDEQRNLQNKMTTKGDADTTADFSLNKYYDKKDWVNKKYYNIIRNQFVNRLKSSRTYIYVNDKINDIATVKYRNILQRGQMLVDNLMIDIELNKYNANNNEYNNRLVIKRDSSANIKTGLKNDNDCIIDFEKYIKDYIQNNDVEATELVMVKDKNTKYDKDNDLVIDKNTISYISFNFLNIKNITEYKNKMNYIAKQIIQKYFPNEIKSINNIKYNVETLDLIQLDNLFRYDRGRKRLVLENKIITPKNIGVYFKDIKKLRATYEDFLDRILKYKDNIKELVKTKKYNLNVSNNELLKILNKNAFNTKSKFLAQIDKISSTETGADGYSITGNTPDKLNSSTDSNKKIVKGLIKRLIKLHILQKPNGYKKPKNEPLFVKFNQKATVKGFVINENNIYVIHKRYEGDTLKTEALYLEEYLLEPDASNNEQKLTVPPGTEFFKTFKKPLQLFDCTNMFRKELIGLANVIEIKSKTTFQVQFDNVGLEFKSLLGEGNSTGENIFIDRPIYVMLNLTKNTSITEIEQNIFENQMYKVLTVQSTTTSSSALLLLQSNYNLITTAYDKTAETNFIYKEVMVSQFINSKDYIENVYFKRVEVNKEDRSFSDAPSFKFKIELKNEIIRYEPIYRNDIIDDYETTMLKIAGLIYENEAKKIHYEIPENIGIYKDTSAAVYSYKYKNNLYISYDKREKPIGNFKNSDSNYLCKKIYRGENFSLNLSSLYNLDSYQEYYTYFENMFKNIVGLHDEINYQCEEYYKSGSMMSNLKLPITFNKYVSFSNNYMLYYKNDPILDDIDKSLLGKHVVINNTVLDNHSMSILNSNRRNSKIYKRFLKDVIYTHKIGRKGFEYEDAKKICERIYTVYDKQCPQPVYKVQEGEYNLDYYRKNKERDECFNIVYNTDKELDKAEFIAKIKGFDPTETGDQLYAPDKQNADIRNIQVKAASTADKNTLTNDSKDSIDTYRKDYLGKTIKNVFDTVVTTKVTSNNKKLKEVKLTRDSGQIEAGKVIFKQYPNNYYAGTLELEGTNKVKITNLIQLPYTGFKKETYTWRNITTANPKDETNDTSTSLTADNINTKFEFKFIDSTKLREETWSKLILRDKKYSKDEEDVKAYAAELKKLEKMGNIQVKPHRIAHLNEIKTAAYYTADWDNIAWINDKSPQVYNKSNLVKVQDKKILWFDKDDENAINKGVICYGRKLDQNKLAQNKKNELYNFQMEKIEQSIKDLQKYENVSKFNREVYSRWNL